MKRHIENLSIGIVAVILIALAMFTDAGAQVVNPTFVGPGGKPATFTNHGVLVGKGTANVVATSAGTAGQCLVSNGASADPTYQSCTTGAGTVTSVSVVTANGLAGTVATATSTPAITLTTSITGVLKGNGTAISAATSGTDYSAGTSALATGMVKSTTTTGALSIGVAGTDYSAGTGALATGILKSTTTTGALSIAVAGDFPTLNQNTTGTAAGLSSTLGVASGGTGLATLTANNVILGNGTSAPSFVAPSTSGNVLTSNGTTWTSTAPGGGALVYLSSYTASNSANIDIETTFDSTYDSYVLVGSNVVPVSSTNIGAQPKINGSYQTSLSYHVTNVASSSASYAGTASDAGFSFPLGGSSPSNNAIQGINFVMYIHHPADTTSVKLVEWVGSSVKSGETSIYMAHGSGGYLGGSQALTGIRIIPNTGNIASGTFRLYGIKNS